MNVRTVTIIAVFMVVLLALLSAGCKNSSEEDLKAARVECEGFLQALTTGDRAKAERFCTADQRQRVQGIKLRAGGIKTTWTIDTEGLAADGESAGFQGFVSTNYLSGQSSPVDSQRFTATLIRETESGQRRWRVSSFWIGSPHDYDPSKPGILDEDARRRRDHEAIFGERVLPPDQTPVAAPMTVGP
jgi:hypothetical protein